jgi:hypothetical protein
MKARIMSVLIIAITSLLLLTFSLTVSAQRSTVDLAIQNIRPEQISGSTFNTTFTSIITDYLPLVFQDYTPCTTIPILLNPANDSNIDTLIPLFSWNNGNDPHATESIVKVTEENDGIWTTSSYYQPGVYTIRFPWNLNPATTYYWQVRLTCKNIQGPYSEVWSFTTNSNGTILPPPLLISPASGSTVPSVQVTLQWSAVPGALEYGVQWIKAGQGWTNIMRVTETHAHLLLAYNSSYTWWIRAINDYAFGDESVHWYFYTPIGPVSLIPQGLIENVIITLDGSGTIFKEQDNLNH